MVSMNKGTNNLQGIRDTGDGQCVVLLLTEFEKFFEKVELTMLRGQIVKPAKTATYSAL